MIPDNPIVKAHYGDLVYNKYAQHISNAPNVKMCIADLGMRTDNNSYNVVESYNIKYRDEPVSNTSGHGDMVAGMTNKFIHRKIDIVNCQIGTYHFHVLDAAQKAVETGCKIFSASMHINSYTMISIWMRRLKELNCLWASHSSHRYNYPSFYKSSDILGQTIPPMGENVTCAIPCNDSKQKVSGFLDATIPSIGVLAGSPSAACPLLASAVAMLLLFEPNANVSDLNKILWDTATGIDNNFRWLRLDKAVESLTGTSLFAETVPIKEKPDETKTEPKTPTEPILKEEPKIMKNANYGERITLNGEGATLPHTPWQIQETKDWALSFYFDRLHDAILYEEGGSWNGIHLFIENGMLQASVWSDANLFDGVSAHLQVPLTAEDTECCLYSDPASNSIILETKDGMDSITIFPLKPHSNSNGLGCVTGSSQAMPQLPNYHGEIQVDIGKTVSWLIEEDIEPEPIEEEPNVSEEPNTAETDTMPVKITVHETNAVPVKIVVHYSDGTISEMEI